jgi:hypothetical protein
MQHKRGLDHIFERGLLGIDVDHAPIRELQRSNAARPHVQRNRAQVRDIEQRLLVIAHEVANFALCVLAPDADGADPVWCELRRILLIERLAIDAIGIARHHQRAVLEIWQEPA